MTFSSLKVCAPRHRSCVVCDVVRIVSQGVWTQTILFRTVALCIPSIALLVILIFCKSYAELDGLMGVERISRPDTESSYGGHLSFRSKLQSSGFQSWRCGCFSWPSGTLGSHGPFCSKRVNKLPCLCAGSHSHTSYYKALSQLPLPLYPMTSLKKRRYWLTWTE